MDNINLIQERFQMEISLLRLERQTEENEAARRQAQYDLPEAAGEACKPYILRLQGALDSLGLPFEVKSYFDAPTTFLSYATQYTRMDRVNTALAQVEALQKQLPKLQAQLEA